MDFMPILPRQRLVAVAYTMLNQPYEYGGDREDCSGFVQECHYAIGTHPQPGTDLTADALYRLRVQRGQIVAIGSEAIGCEAFWLSGGVATHVELVCAVQPTLCVGAAGGTSETRGGDELLGQVGRWMRVADADLTEWVRKTHPVAREWLRAQSGLVKADLRNARVRIRPLLRNDARTLVLADPWKSTVEVTT